MSSSDDDGLLPGGTMVWVSRASSSISKGMAR
jgi:hypothetical protein